MANILFLLVALATASTVSCHVTQAVVHLQSTVVTGMVTFTEQDDGQVHVSGVIEGLTPGAYGFHMHQLGDPTNNCLASGAHFNPEDVTHGGPDHEVRHVGDFGNVNFDENNVAHIDFVDRMISLNGENGVVGRTLVLHEGQDDLGLGGHEDSLTTGNAGARVGCGVVGILQEVSAASFSPPPGWLAATLLCVLVRGFQ